MFERVLYPTDFSDAAYRALDCIIQLQMAGTREVIVLHVVDQRDIFTMEEHTASPADIARIKQVWEDEIAREMAAITDELTGAGLQVTQRVIYGTPFETILQVEDEYDVSAIVLGSHGKSNIEEMLLGSVSEKVIRKSHKPVIVIKR